MQVPTLNEIRTALFAKMQDTLAEEEDSGKIFIVPTAQDSDPALKLILVISGFSPNTVERQELGGYEALAERKGIWKMTISSLKDTNAGEPWAIAQKLEEAFSAYTVDGLPIADQDEDNDEPCAIYCEFPYSENVGTLPDGRNGITVTVPWWAWTQN